MSWSTACVTRPDVAGVQRLEAGAIDAAGWAMPDAKRLARRHRMTETHADVPHSGGDAFRGNHCPPAAWALGSRRN
jgi:hypothetical protein